MYQESDIKSWAEVNAEALEKQLQVESDIPDFLKGKNSPIRPIFIAGNWLDKRLRDMGVSDNKKRNDICFAFGQRCFGNDPYKMAVKFANEYMETGANADANKPKAELAEEITNEVLNEA